MLTGQRWVLASHSKHKLEEMRALLAPAGVALDGAGELGLALPVEATAAEGADFHSNARLKAEAVFAQCGRPTLADDSGLCVEALGGLPGVDTAHFGGWPALLAAMENVPAGQRQGAFVCVLALVGAGAELIFFEGRCGGVISPAARGENGFDYDPVFEVEGRTFGEMTAEEKARHSHRALAAKELLKWLENSHG
ncbi:MAG: non-canonical purine NTP pyrophosphatase [Proteobacteria bacterium]|nr:non-canonical purine NTP pyrophosphatase [Pseudomonadota bacterium]